MQTLLLDSHLNAAWPGSAALGWVSVALGCAVPLCILRTVITTGCQMCKRFDGLLILVEPGLVLCPVGTLCFSLPS